MKADTPSATALTVSLMRAVHTRTAPQPGPAPDAFSAVQKRVAALGEPFISGFDPLSLGENLRSVGLALEEDFDDIQLISRYDSQGVNGLQSAPLSHIARALIPLTPACSEHVAE